MAQLNYNPMEDRAAFNIATSGPTSAIPKNYGQPASAAPVSTSGNIRPLQPPPGTDWVDKICIAADQRERAQAQQPDAMQLMLQSSMQMQQLMAKLIDVLVDRLNAAEAPEPKVKEKKP